MTLSLHGGIYVKLRRALSRLCYFPNHTRYYNFILERQFLFYSFISSSFSLFSIVCCFFLFITIITERRTKKKRTKLTKYDVKVLISYLPLSTAKRITETIPDTIVLNNNFFLPLIFGFQISIPSL